MTTRTTYYNFRDALAIKGDRDTTTKHHRGSIQGIDVSRWQGEIDWGRVACHLNSVDVPGFAYVKATEGVGYLDKRFSTNVDQAQAAGLDVGAYHFARVSSGEWAGLDAADEIGAFHEACKGHDLELPPVIDLELGGIGGRPAAYTRDWLREAVATARELFGREPVIYTGYWTWRHMKRPAEFDGLDLWLANYTNKRRPSVSLDGWSDNLRIWQYTGKGTIPGIKGNVDRNRWMGTTWEYRRWRARGLGPRPLAVV